MVPYSRQIKTFGIPYLLEYITQTNISLLVIVIFFLMPCAKPSIRCNTQQIRLSSRDTK